MQLNVRKPNINKLLVSGIVLVIGFCMVFTNLIFFGIIIFVISGVVFIKMLKWHLLSKNDIPAIDINEQGISLNNAGTYIPMSRVTDVLLRGSSPRSKSVIVKYYLDQHKEIEITDNYEVDLVVVYDYLYKIHDRLHQEQRHR